MQPSKFYEKIGKSKGYAKLVSENRIPDITKFVTCNTIESKEPICIIANLGKDVEKCICEFLSNIPCRSDVDEVFQKKYIRGTNLYGFLKLLNSTCDRNPEKCLRNIKCREGYGEIDLIYGNILIDIKSYKKFTNTNIKQSFLQTIIYYDAIKSEINIKYLGVYVPTLNRFYVMKTSDIDPHLTSFVNLYENEIEIKKESISVEIKKKKKKCFIL